MKVVKGPFSAREQQVQRPCVMTGLTYWGAARLWGPEPLSMKEGSVSGGRDWTVPGGQIMRTLVGYRKKFRFYVNCI